MSDAGDDDQDQAEALDDDDLDPGDFPPDHSIGLRELATQDVLFADEYAPDTVEDRDRREEPEVEDEPLAFSERESVVGLLEPDLEDGSDLEGDLVGDEAELDDERGGVVLSDELDSRADVSNEPAEEAAIHLEGE
jgi:hypothetical protein